MDDHASKSRGLLWVLAACVIGVFFSLGLTPLARAIPWSWEKALSKALSFEALQQECVSPPETKALLERLVARLYPLLPGDGNFSIEIKAVHDESINAYATLGGKIYVNAGLLKEAESPEELAGVLAHEIAHVQRRHIMEGALARLFTAQGIEMMFGAGGNAAEWMNYFLSMNFTRVQEAQADQAGLDRLQAAHVDNRGFRRFFERMGKHGSALDFLSDHPSNPDRIAMVEAHSNTDAVPLMTAAEWERLKNLCGDK